MDTRPHWAGTAGLGLAIATTWAGAAEPGDRYHLGETITVVGERLRLADEVATTDTVTAEDIERRGARTLDEAIALLPGVYVRMGADGVPRVDIRGLRTRNILLLQDGVPLNSSYDGQFDPAAIPVDNIASIKVVRGASSMLYGPGGNAGVIEIVTRTAGAEPDGRLLVEGTDPQAWLARGAVGGTIGPVGLTLTGSLYDRDHFDLPDDFAPTTLQPGDQRVNSDREDQAVQGNLVFGGQGRSLGLSLAWREGEYGKPPTTVNSTESVFASRPRFERVDFDSLSLQAAAEFPAGETLVLRPTLYLNRSDELTDGYDDAGFDSQSKAGAFREDSNTEVYGGGLLATMTVGRDSLLSISLAGRDENWKATGFNVVTVTGGGSGGGGGGGGGGGSTTAARPFAEDESLNLFSVGAEAELPMTDSLGLIAGLGYSRQDRSDGPGDDGSSWLLGARYALSEAGSLRASASRQIRYPTLRDLYAADRGNPDLEPETTDTIELAWRHDFTTPRVALEAVLFHIEADDFIERIPGGITQNFEAYRFQGLELTAARRETGPFGLSASYTYTDSENQSRDADTTILQNRPEHKFALRVDYEIRPSLRVGGTWLYVADSYALSRTTPTTTLKLDNYNVLDLDVSFGLGPRGRVFARVENALDELYEESFGFPQAGRTFVLGAELRL
jgi:outer membrane cobalamin receptor